MINNNIITEQGLYNGKMGTVEAVIYEKGVYPPKLPKAVIVKVDGEEKINKSFCFNKETNLVVIEPMRQLKADNMNVSRT